ncbi:MAG: OmpA family protein [Bacteroidia bacterium]
MKKTYPVLLLSLGLLFSGCGAKYFLNKGNNKYDAYAYSEAVTQYQKSIDKEPLYEAKSKLANSYRLMNNLSAAEETYREVVAMEGSTPEDQFFYGKVLMQNQKYGEAKAAFSKYAESVPDDAIVKSLIEACDNPSKFDNQLDTCAYSIKAIELSGLTSSFGATPYNYGYVFTAQTIVEDKAMKDPYSGMTYMDMYYTKKDKAGAWLPPDFLKGGVNSEYHDAFATVSVDGQTMYFTRTNQTKGRVKKNEENMVSLKIFKAVFLEGEWTNIEEFPFNSDDYSNAHPALSPDGKKLYFSSDRPGGYGQTDIYVTEMNGDTWGEPKNVGPMINTAGRDMMPQMGFDEKLYFSSDGHAGMGGLDIFKSSMKGDSWSQPVNMKSPINSSRDDFSFNLDADGKVGNLSSTRSGVDRLYEVIYKDPVISAEICVKDKESKGAFAGAMVYAQNNETGVLDSASTDAVGVARFRLPGGHNFTVNARFDQTLTNSIEISTVDKPCSDVIRTCDDGKIIELERTTGPRVIDIYYDYNKWDIRADAALVLDKMVQLLIDNPNYKVEFGSHTDCRGDEAYNQKLSENRAKSVVKYCTLRDIDPKRLTYKGYGESQPSVNCECTSCTEDEHQLNRRTEFKIIE